MHALCDSYAVTVIALVDVLAPSLEVKVIIAEPADISIHQVRMVRIVQTAGFAQDLACKPLFNFVCWNEADVCHQLMGFYELQGREWSPVIAIIRSLLCHLLFLITPGYLKNYK